MAYWFIFLALLFACYAVFRIRQVRRTLKRAMRLAAKDQGKGKGKGEIRVLCRRHTCRRHSGNVVSG